MLSFENSMRLAEEIIDRLMDEYHCGEYSAFNFHGGEELMIKSGICREVMEIWYDVI